ncbi:glycosyltransferase [Aquipuribacter sp. SD81]|uniref:glycosyltransferase n=1 Tax=Aquipuribacter sp. SD81 TaxID=3127703 RepID=UPI00301A5F2A
MAREPDGGFVHEVSVAVPVYQGQTSLVPVVEELLSHVEPATTPDGHVWRVAEVLLVHDNGPDDSAGTIRALAARHDVVRPVWLSRNFGQHAATLAGMASSGGDWVVTMDEDGQHDPADIARFLDTAMREQAALVYARPTNPAPHGSLRNSASRAAKWVFSKVLSPDAPVHFQSYRLVLGEVGRSVAAYAGAGVYLDVAIGWVANRTAYCPVVLREEHGRRSGYSWRSLLAHFWRLALSSGTRGLRVVSVLGVLLAVLGVALAVVLVVARLAGDVPVQGWTSVMVVTLIGTGSVLLCLGVVAEYVGVAVGMAMGRPLFLLVGDPAAGPLGAAPAGRDGR